MLAPTYTPGVNDIANGSVVLTLTGSGNGSCGPVNDSMTLTITPAPVVGAGSDEEICQGGTHDFSASGVPPSASNTSALLWQTAGDGTFSDPNILLPVYTPGANDIANGSVVLTLRGAGNGSCGPVNDSMTLTINARPPVVDAELRRGDMPGGCARPVELRNRWLHNGLSGTNAPCYGAVRETAALTTPPCWHLHIPLA